MHVEDKLSHKWHKIIGEAFKAAGPASPIVEDIPYELRSSESKRKYVQDKMKAFF